MQRTLIRLLRFLPIPLVYGVMGLVIPFYMLFDRKGYQASWRFFRQRIGYGPLRAFCSVYANEFRLGQVVIDRFALYAGRRFDLQIEHYERFKALSEDPSGFVQVSSHVGNYELAGYSLRVENKKMFALVFPGETQTVMAQRSAIFGRMNIGMVPVSDDLSHLFALNAALLDGHIVSMPGDRIFGSQKSYSCDFLGAPARFPAGPFLLAAQRAVPMLAVFVMKESVRKYRIFIEKVEKTVDAGLPARERAAQLAADFAAQLERIVRRYPTQWYNFYDFWK